MRTIAHLRTEVDSKDNNQRLEGKEWKDALENKILEINRIKDILEEKEDEIEKLSEEKNHLEIDLNKSLQEKKALTVDRDNLNSLIKEKDWKIRDFEKNLEKSSFEKKDLFEKLQKVNFS